MNFHKWDEMTANHLNGNLSTFKKQVMGLSRKDLLKFLEMCERYSAHSTRASVYNMFEVSRD